MPEIIPVFPLHMVLFPGGSLSLKIFEARYLDMVSECLRNNSGFGICLIRQGQEVGRAAAPEEVGTLVTIADFQRYPDGLLGITVRGRQRFQLITTQVQPDHLLRGEIGRLVDAVAPVTARYTRLQELFLRLAEPDQHVLTDDSNQLHNAAWLGYRLAELLPLELQDKQDLLEINAPQERLERLLAWYNQSDEVNRPG